MTDEKKMIGINLFPPIQLTWRGEQQELDIEGVMLIGLEEKPGLVRLNGPAAVEALRAFRDLLARVDEDELSARTPRDLQ